jgi:hypothetical protein
LNVTSRITASSPAYRATLLYLDSQGVHTTGYQFEGLKKIGCFNET